MNDLPRFSKYLLDAVKTILEKHEGDFVRTGTIARQIGCSSGTVLRYANHLVKIDWAVRTRVGVEYAYKKNNLEIKPESEKEVEKCYVDKNSTLNQRIETFFIEKGKVGGITQKQIGKLVGCSDAVVNVAIKKLEKAFMLVVNRSNGVVFDYKWVGGEQRLFENDFKESNLEPKVENKGVLSESDNTNGELDNFVKRITELQEEASRGRQYYKMYQEEKTARLEEKQKNDKFEKISEELKEKLSHMTDSYFDLKHKFNAAKSMWEDHERERQEDKKQLAELKNAKQTLLVQLKDKLNWRQ